MIKLVAYENFKSCRFVFEMQAASLVRMLWIQSGILVLHAIFSPYSLVTKLIALYLISYTQDILV